MECRSGESICVPVKGPADSMSEFRKVAKSAMAGTAASLFKTLPNSVFKPSLSRADRCPALHPCARPTCALDQVAAGQAAVAAAVQAEQQLLTAQLHVEGLKLDPAALEACSHDAAAAANRVCK